MLSLRLSNMTFYECRRKQCFWRKTPSENSNNINKCYFKHDLFMGHIFLTTFMQLIKHSIVDSIDLS